MRSVEFPSAVIIQQSTAKRPLDSPLCAQLVSSNLMVCEFYSDCTWLATLPHCTPTRPHALDFCTIGQPFQGLYGINKSHPIRKVPNFSIRCLHYSGMRFYKLPDLKRSTILQVPPGIFRTWSWTIGSSHFKAFQKGARFSIEGVERILFPQIRYRFWGCWYSPPTKLLLVQSWRKPVFPAPSATWRHHRNRFEFPLHIEGCLYRARCHEPCYCEFFPHIILTVDYKSSFRPQYTS